MTFNDSVRNRTHLYFNGLVLLCVVQVAGLTIARSQYGDPAGDSTVLQWYGLAVMYAAASCLTLASGPSGRNRLLASSVLLLGAGVCGYFSQTLVPVSVAQSPVAWYDWMVLGTGFLGRAGCRMLFGK